MNFCSNHFFSNHFICIGPNGLKRYEDLKKDTERCIYDSFEQVNGSTLKPEEMGKIVNEEGILMYYSAFIML